MKNQHSSTGTNETSKNDKLTPPGVGIGAERWMSNEQVGMIGSQNKINITYLVSGV